MNFSKLTVLLPLGLGLLASGPDLAAQPGTPPPVPKILRTNAPVMPALQRTNPAAPPKAPARTPVNAPAVKAPAVKAPAAKAGTNAVATPAASSGTNSVAADLLNKVRAFPSSPAFFPAIGACFALVIIALLFWRSKSQKPTAISPASSGARAAKRGGKVHACNVLQVAPEARHLWHFDARSSRFALARQHTARGDKGLPSNVVGKDWTALFQRKLNIAWLPAEHVFMRVIQLPVSDFNETLSMIEFQLEKLSPMPVAQIVWTIQVLPQAQGKGQTVVVLMVARNVVEEFLGRLEGHGYLADRLDFPLLDQLLATPIAEDGAWIYPDASGSALVAWWFRGVLQNVNLINLPTENRPENLREQLVQLAWAGEMEGWLTGTPQWHLVAEESIAAEWEPAFREGMDQPIQVSAPVPTTQLAALTARRAAADEAQGNLLPAEFATRYQQQFVDRLWMRGLGAVVGVYLIGVMIYFVALQFATYRTGQVEARAAEMGPTYTNALQVEARYQVLKDRQDLKYAALECWKAVASLMPTDLTLDSFNFSDGRRLTLSGSAATDKVSQLLEFESAMRKYTVDGQPFFAPSKGGDNLNYHANPANATVSWNFALELKRVEVQ